MSRELKDKGFSLIELVVVMILLSLTGALVVPSLSRFSKGVEFKGAAKRVAAILRFSRSEAVNQGKVYQVFFDADLRQVRMQSVETEEGKTEGEPAQGKTSQKIYSMPPDVQIKEVKVEEPEFPSELPTIEFYPNGGSNGGSVLLDGGDGKVFKITVFFLTGEVKIEQS